MEHRRSSHSDGMTTSTTTEDAETDRGRVSPKEEEHGLGTEPGQDSSPEEEDDDDASTVDGTGPEASRVSTNVSIAETISLPHELLLVAVVCLAQLYTQAALGNTIGILKIIGSSYGITDPAELSWIIAGYSLTVGTFIMFSGRLGDVYGYKPLFLIGMAWFSVWNVVCGLAIYSNHVLLIFARVLQGIGPAICLTNGLAILGASYGPGKRKALAFAAFGATAPGGSILGAVFAGLFARHWWPWAYFCFAVVLALSVVLSYYVIPSRPSLMGRPRETWPRGLWPIVHELDVAGAATGITGLVLINFAWNQAPLSGWTAPFVYVLLLIGILFIAAFFVIEMRYAKHPLIPFDALSVDVLFVLGAVACGWSCFGIWIMYTWQFFEEFRGATPLLATAWFSPVAVSGCAASVFTGMLIHRLGPAVVMTAALLFFTAGITLIATAPVDQPYWSQAFVSMLVTPWGMDMSFPAATLILSNAVHRKHQGIAASLINTVVNYSIALGLGFAGTVEYKVNNGGRTPEDRLRGFHGAYYMGIGLAGLGVLICIAYLVKAHRTRRDERLSEKA
ncbi:aminotriazole resistance [Apiospora saccharicola]|uniref:Aminotriazole resistance n=1 Tax=Apiospora saccharicola TaxID=335842 RepID=A0ABR1UF51_9PEZI